MKEWKSGKIKDIEEMKSRLKQDLDNELSAREVDKLTRKSKKQLNQLQGSARDDLFKIESRNYLRSAQVVRFIRKQLQKFRAMGSKILANQLKYTRARKKIWMENDQLNRIENQKVYEEELGAYVLRFQLIKKQLDKNFRKMEKKARKSASKLSEKILKAQIKKYAKALNEEYKEGLVADYDTFWGEEVEAIREMDRAFDKEWKDDLKMANIALAKFE